MTGKFPGTIEVTDPVIITITNGTFKPTGSIGVDDENDWCLGFRICEAPFRGNFMQPFEVDRGAVSKEDSGDLVWVLVRVLSTPPWALRSRSSTTNAGGQLSTSPRRRPCRRTPAREMHAVGARPRTRYAST